MTPEQKDAALDVLKRITQVIERAEISTSHVYQSDNNMRMYNNVEPQRLKLEGFLIPASKVLQLAADLGTLRALVEMS